ncbi:MAG: UvrD-helicase domain-containing protein [Spirochaetes bacterium]|nr:UvrD-helicase domain-containing protein [Spirochaetota bacterium]
MKNNKLIIAAAGSGKTSLIVNEALNIKDEKVLITTYTQANEAEIKTKIIELNKCIPENITVQTWFSFLLKHGARPFQGILLDKKIKGLILVNSQSGIKGYVRNGQPIYFGEEKDFEKHYFSNQLKIYSDKLSKFVFRCNEKTKGSVIDRISRIYAHVFIDEVQDLAGYDLELLKLLFDCNSNVLLVGDPRQGTYSTNSAPKNKQFKKAKIVNFFTDKEKKLTKDDTMLIVNYRCIKPICELSNKLFPTMQKTTSGNNRTTDHDGIFFVKKKDVEKYLHQYEPLQLRDSRRTTVSENHRVMNFGESKGLSFDRILIYPTAPMLKWLKNKQSELKDTSRSKFYVAITRAKYSVGFVVEDTERSVIDGITYYSSYHKF